MTLYHVSFKMPGWIAKGIAEGFYEVYGGVVRYVGSKQVVMWLRPAIQGAVPTGRLLPLAGLSGGALLATAVSASVTVVALAGFGYLAHLHTESEKRLQKILWELDQTKLGLDQVLKNQIDAIRHKMESAIDSLRDEEARGHFAAFQAPITALRECARFYHAKMEELLRTDNPLVHATIFVEYAILHGIACQAKARALSIYRDKEAAFEEAGKDAAEYALCREKFIAPFRAPEKHLLLFVSLDEDVERLMREAVQRLPVRESYFLPSIETLTGDVSLLNALNEVALPRANEDVAGIIPVNVAPAGWLPEHG
jgi:hypothetical protein